MTDDGQDASFTIRLPAELLRHAQSMAASRDETLSQVVRRALRAYVKAGPAQLDLEDAIGATRRAGSKLGAKGGAPKRRPARRA
jgi:predicted transcriptional regulator